MFSGHCRAEFWDAHRQSEDVNLEASLNRFNQDTIDNIHEIRKLSSSSIIETHSIRKPGWGFRKIFIAYESPLHYFSNKVKNLF